MYTGVFMLVVGLALAASLLISIILLATCGACESASCVIATALVDTAFHIIVIALLFEPARRYIEALNRKAARKGLIGILKPKAEALTRSANIDPPAYEDRPYMRFAGDISQLRFLIVSLTPTVLHLSEEEMGKWSEIDSAISKYFGESASRAGPERVELVRIVEALDQFLDAVGQMLPRQTWSEWFPFKPT